ncbi:DUF5753 domain-containing protein [Streptomyces chattanoogensis]|uniref:DUF5753 domain-containing protein n=1 Tax=Streptomyces chattanoogensis TaxID=66876 RepID=UPI0036875BC4
MGPIPPDLPPLLDQVFSTDGLFQRLYEETVTQSFPSAYKRRLEVESKAIHIAEWSPTWVPGLLQTESYARALFRAGAPRASEAQLSREAAARVARQGVLRGSSRPNFSVIVCESAIRRNVGGPDVMRKQLAALLAFGTRPANILQVRPLAAPVNCSMESSISLLTTPDGATIFYSEGIRSRVLIDEPSVVRHYSWSYELLAASAFSPEASANLIRELMEAL